MADLSSNSTIAGFPIIHEGNYKEYLYTDKNDQFITVAESEELFSKMFDTNATGIVKTGDFILDTTKKTLQVRTGNAWSSVVLSANGGPNPSGSIIMFAGNNAGDSYIFCDGRELSRTTYAKLFGIIGTRYGAGNGSTTFNIPDIRGLFVRGWDHGRGVDSGRGLGTYQEDQIIAHSHSGTTNTTGEHNHGIPNDFSMTPDSPGYNENNWGGPFSTRKVYTSYSGDHSHTFTSTATGGSETRPRNKTLNFFITL